MLLREALLREALSKDVDADDWVTVVVANDQKGSSARAGRGFNTLPPLKKIARATKRAAMEVMAISKAVSSRRISTLS